MLPIQIITDKRRIETSSDKVFYVLATELKQTCLDENPAYSERIYKLQCGSDAYEVVCPEIQKSEGPDAAASLIIPEFMIPGRPYPIYVYLYAIVLYSSNPGMGQREAAEKTRKRFGLKTFSHTTLGRAIKKLETRIKSEWGNEAKETRPDTAGVFRSVELTRQRRDTVLSYLKEASGQDNQLIQEPSQPQPTLNYRRPPYIGAFIDACHRVVEYTFVKYRRLLL